MPVRSYLFYDLETSGLNKCFDQVVQFAAIRTDLELNELERYELYVRLNPDVVPSPSAFLTHKIPLAKLADGITEYAAVRQIHQLFNTPGTITVGYNTLGFDDEFLRFAFYHNLLTPYTHQYVAACGRMDIYPMTVVYRLFAPEVLNWPQVDGHDSLRLEHLSAANKLMTGGAAHNALVDVLATVELARRLKGVPKIWNYLESNFNKNLELQQWQKWSAQQEMQTALLIEGRLGGKRCYQTLGLCLGMHRHYRNQCIWLRLDEVPFTTELLCEDFYIIRKRFGEPPLLLPHISRYLKWLTPERQELAENNLVWLKEHPQLLTELVNYHLDYCYPSVPHLDVDAALYENGFLSEYEQQQCQLFHQGDLSEKIELVAGWRNPQLRAQALRVLGRNFSSALAEVPAGQQLLQEFRAYLQELRQGKVKIDYKNSESLTIAQAEQELAELTTKLTEPNDCKLLTELRQYIKGLILN